MTDRQPRTSREPRLITLATLCTELGIARSTFYQWRQLGRAPRCIKLPNGELRIRRADLDTWIERHSDDGAA